MITLMVDTLMGMGSVFVFGVGVALLATRDPFGKVIENDDDLA